MIVSNNDTNIMKIYTYNTKDC